MPKNKSTAEILSKRTNRDREDFEYNGDIPDIEELTMVDAEEFYGDSDD